MLQPTKVDAAEGRRPQALRLIEQDPYERPERLQQLQQELETFRGQLGDAGALEATWRELQEAQEHDARGRSIAIARCYSLKNRHQDVMPYDSNRVVLRSGKDDYINASCVEGLSPYCPPLVATQAPLPGTAADFWLMVHEQKVSVIVMLVSEAEMEKVRWYPGGSRGGEAGSPGKLSVIVLSTLQQKVARYFPTERGQPMVHGALSVALSSIRTTDTHVERVLSLQFRDQSLKRSLVHLHFPTWPELCVHCSGWWGQEQTPWGLGMKASHQAWFIPAFSLQRPARQPWQSAALHPGGACTLFAPATPAHTYRGTLQVGAGSCRSEALYPMGS